MVDATHISFKASDRSYFSLIKKDIHNLAKNAGFSDKKLADLDIIVSEITSNLHKHARNGEILVGLFKEKENLYIELIGIDNGPGMQEPFKMIKDGFSSANTMGIGLGSIQRLSTQFDLYSMKGWGTIILTRIYNKTVEPGLLSTPKVTIRKLVVTMPGQIKCGDGTSSTVTPQHFKLLVADGLGHGEEANFAVIEAVKAFKQCTDHSPSEILKYIHEAIRKTRGIVGSIVVFDFESNIWKMAGVGNISTRMSNFLQIKNQMSYNGTVGHNILSGMSDQEVKLEDYNQVTSCSDGINPRWDTSKFTGISRCDLSIQAAAIYKDFAGKTDDMAVVIAKINQG
ncbi:MAG: Stage sporulation family protein [Mucilaginibacter sp.]|nr:Stage sporulation family protein [Mucilaginibacter sp.]